jgi:periplasmic protein TonB
MKRTVSLFEFMPYGAPELLAATRPHLALSLAAASLTLLLAFCAALQIIPGLRTAVAEHEVHADLMGVDLLPPPPIYAPIAPKVAISRVSASAPRATPIVVPDEIVTHADDMRSGDAATGKAGGAYVSPAEPDAGASGAAEEIMPVRGVFQPVDELPVPITPYKPTYPDLAHDFGVEGLVIVHALIGKDGRVVRVELDEKFAIPLLNQTALEAAKRWVFQPALVHGQPVPVWTDIPFHFVLHE